jgi:hypothetical protein
MSNTTSDRLWIAITGTLLLACLLVSGCAGRPPASSTPAGDTSTPVAPGGVASQLSDMSIWCAWAGGIALLTALVCAWFRMPKRAATAGAAAGGLWIAAWMMERAAVHLDLIGWASVIVIGVAGLLYIYANREGISKAVGNLPGEWDDHWHDDDETERHPIIERDRGQGAS